MTIYLDCSLMRAQNSERKVFMDSCNISHTQKEKKLSKMMNKSRFGANASVYLVPSLL